MMSMSYHSAMREPLYARGDRFREELREAEPRQLDALIEFAARLEERLDLAIPTDALNEDNFRTHASVATMIESLKGAQEC